MRPLIAVTGRTLDAGRVTRWANGAVAVPTPYIEALRRAGAQEAILQPVPLDDAVAARLLEHFDGLLLTGGGDVEPWRYGADPAEEVYGTDTDTDTFELALCRAAAEHSVPTLGICRGIQVLDVAFGGTLHQHITDRQGFGAHGRPGVAGGAADHEVRIAAGSRLAEAVGALRADCSSHHHQAVDRLGAGLVPVAWTEDGLVEAAEVDGDGWFVAVQWHPEDTAGSDPRQQGLFDAFVGRAAVRVP